MKVLAALFALLFATSAQAAVRDFHLVATFTHQYIYNVFDDNRDNFDVPPITPGSNPYNFSGGTKFDSLRDGRDYDFRLTFDDAGGSMTTCSIGGIDCYLLRLSFYSDFGNGGFNAGFGEYGSGGYILEINADGTGTFMDYAIDTIIFGTDPATGRELYARNGFLVNFALNPLPEVPLPASGLLLVGGLGLIGAIRRFRR